MSANETSLPFKSIVAALWTGNLFAPFLVTGVAAMLPAIGATLGASAVALSLVMVCYNLGQGISHILSGRICGIVGVKRVLLAGMASFSLFGLLLGCVNSMPMVIGLRLAQGVAAAAISCCVTSLSVTIAAPERRAAMISTVVSAVYLGLAVGPLICGGLTELTGWRTVFFLLAALGGVEFFFLLRVLPADAASAPERPFNMVNALLMSLSLTLITLGSTFAFLHPAVRLMLPVGLILLVLFVRLDWRSENPILDLRLLAKVPGLPGGMTATFINYGSFMGLSVLFSLYLQQVLGLNAFTAGMVLMTQCLFQTLCSPLVGRIVGRYDPALISTGGMILCGLSLLAFTTLDADSPVGMVVVMEALLGIGVAFFVAPNMAATLGQVPRQHMPIASGLLGCLRTLGGLGSHIVIAAMLGVFLADAEVGPENTADFLRCMRWILVIFGCLNLIGVLFSMRRVRNTG